MLEGCPFLLLFVEGKLEQLQFPQNMTDVPESFYTMSHGIQGGLCTTIITIKQPEGKGCQEGSGS